MCEDLGAEPLFVINCGMSHEEQGTAGPVDVPKLAEYLQDALDAIEYANGRPTASGGRCGQGRTPGPLPPRVHGNRQRERRPDLRQSTTRCSTTPSRPSIPQMHLVANMHDAARPVDIDDEHYYSNPEFFMAQCRQVRQVQARRRTRSTSANTRSRRVRARAICGPPSARRPS